MIRNSLKDISGPVAVEPSLKNAVIAALADSVASRSILASSFVNLFFVPFFFPSLSCGVVAATVVVVVVVVTPSTVVVVVFSTVCIFTRVVGELVSCSS